MRAILLLLFLAGNTWAAKFTSVSGFVTFDERKSTTTSVIDPLRRYVVAYSSYAINVVTNGSNITVSRRIKTYRQFTRQIDDKTFEIGLRFLVRPTTNMWQFEVEGAENAEFFYQPELTQEEKDRGDYRPENMVGGFAVYHKDGYRLFEIHRPKLIDALGNWIWADLSYDDGLLKVVGNKAWLASATYPVVLDPEFGYTTLAAAESLGWNGWIGQLEQFTSTVSANVSTMSVGCKGASDIHMKVALYFDNGADAAGGLVPNSYAGEQTQPLTKGWKTWSIAGTTITAGGIYWFGFMVDHSNVTIYKDAVTHNRRNVATATAYADFPTAICPDGGILRTDLRFSFYITYTEGGDTGAPKPKTQRALGGIID